MGKKRAPILERDGHACKLCGGEYRLTVHHISYEHLYNEKDDELVTLCAPCHEKLHQVLENFKECPEPELAIEEQLRQLEEKLREMRGARLGQTVTKVFGPVPGQKKQAYQVIVGHSALSHYSRIALIPMIQNIQSVKPIHNSVKPVKT